ncbi:hypothetical protein SLS60_006873 [Paraconiothyrium brasiliense]|uniref:Uncharacterized protein n=1 Tax=Paraconiothyrium brasiliense TaxID=300254 RepID=A0ABR3R814_9PLEO
MHPLPHEDKDEVQSERRDDTDVEVEPESEHVRISKEKENSFALFDDASEINVGHFAQADDHFAQADDENRNVGAFLRAEIPLDGPKVRTQKPSNSTTHKARSSDPSATTVQFSKDISTHGASNALKEPNNALWVNSDESTVAYRSRRASLDAVCDYIPNAHHVENHDRRRSSSEYDPHHGASTDEDEEPHRKPLVRFADAHTILCTPLPPTPPPHQTSFSPAPLPPPIPISPTELSYTAPIPARDKPYGPRIPPWGSTDILDRERRLRTDVRLHEDTLEKRFGERDRLRKAEEARKGTRRTEGEELRELVLGIYPELEETEDRGRYCWMCAIM